MIVIKEPVEAFLFGVEPIPDWFMDRVTDNTIILHRVPFDEARARNYGMLWCEIHQDTEVVNAYEGSSMIILGNNNYITVLSLKSFSSIFKEVSDPLPLYEMGGSPIRDFCADLKKCMQEEG